MKRMRHLFRRRRVWMPLAIVSAAIVCVGLINRHALSEGMRYVFDGVVYEPVSERQIERDGPFGITYELVSQTSRERSDAIKRRLSELGVDHEAIPVADGYDNIFVPGEISDVFLLIDAHYDKVREDPEYQGATDNTGSVAVLLAAIEELGEELPNRRAAFLFTALEETGLRGAYRFVEVAKERDYRIDGVLCLDGVGRGPPVLATIAPAVGLRFWLPFWGWKLFDGSKVRDAPQVWPIDEAIRSTYVPQVRTNRAFLANTNANAFLTNGIPSVHIWGGNVWHGDQTWHSNSDTVERLDEDDLMQVKDVIMAAVERLGQ